MWLEIWIRTSPSPLNSASPESERARPEYDTSMVVPRICCSCHVSRQGAECLRRGYKRPNSPSAILVDERQTKCQGYRFQRQCTGIFTPEKSQSGESRKTQSGISLKTPSGESMNWR